MASKLRLVEELYQRVAQVSMFIPPYPESLSVTHPRGRANKFLLGVGLMVPADEADDADDESSSSGSDCNSVPCSCNASSSLGRSGGMGGSSASLALAKDCWSSLIRCSFLLFS